MPDRTRPIRKEICLNEQELNLIQHKMRQLGTHNFGAYTRKMLIDGYIIKVNYTEQKKLAAAVSRVASNINLPPHQSDRAILCCRYCRAESTSGRNMVAFERIAKTGIMNVRGAQYAAHE